MSDANVLLRDFEPGDAAAVQRWFNNTDATHSLMEYRDSMDEEGARRWVDAAMRKDGRDRKWAVLVEGFDEPVGFTALYGVGGQTAPELGAMLGADGLRGKGVGKHAESLTIQKGFDEFGAWRILGLIPAHNLPAQAVVKRLGFKHEGTMREHIRRPDGELIDCEVYGLLKSDWKGYP
ncbi:MAG TPA: GNAT family protein [Thermoleophilaceae bacterium]